MVAEKLINYYLLIRYCNDIRGNVPVYGRFDHRFRLSVTVTKENRVKKDDNIIKSRHVVVRQMYSRSLQCVAFLRFIFNEICKEG